MVHKIFNASDILGAIAFLAMLAAPGAWDGAIESGGPYIFPVALTAMIPVCAYLAMKEDGKIR